jgi:hypothetical protein
MMVGCIFRAMSMHLSRVRVSPLVIIFSAIPSDGRRDKNSIRAIQQAFFILVSSLFSQTSLAKCLIILFTDVSFLPSCPRSSVGHPFFRTNWIPACAGMMKMYGLSCVRS